MPGESGCEEFYRMNGCQERSLQSGGLENSFALPFENIMEGKLEGTLKDLTRSDQCVMNH